MTFPTPHLRTPTAALSTLAGLLFLAACAGGRTPEPASGPLAAPGLAGQRVVVFPVQNASVPGDADRELTFALSGRGGTDQWVLPGDLRRSLARSPQLDVPLDQLPVGQFLRAEVRRVGDPLYGMIRRAAALSGSALALLPVGIAFRPATPPADGGTVELMAAVVNVTSGVVIWLDRVEGSASSEDDPAGLARVMDALATSLLAGGD